MQLIYNPNSNPFIFISNAIMEKNSRKKMYLGTHETDYDEYNNGGIYHTDVEHEDAHEDGWAGYLDINKTYTNNYWKENPKW